MLELTAEQQHQLKLPEKQKIVKKALDHFQKELPRIYRKHGHDTLKSRLEEGYTVAVELGISKKKLIFTYMLYSVSAPLLRNVTRMQDHFQKSSNRPDLVAQDLFTLLKFRPGSSNKRT
ncbi:hypothetical protein DYI26_09135 [Halomonas litopenaei]|nr:hypothetical protein [Halomonas litopenaei]